MDEQNKINKDKTISDLAYLAKIGLIAKEDVLKIFDLNFPQETLSDKKIDLKQLMYYVGGFIAMLGVIFFVGQYWNRIDNFSRVFLTLVPAVSFYALGYFFKSKSSDLSQALFLISVVLFPMGISTWFDSLGIKLNTSESISIISFLLYLIYFISYQALRVDIFLPFSILSVTVFFFHISNFLAANSLVVSHFDEYRVLIIGISYILLGFYFSNTNRKFMENLMYFFGLLMVFASSMFLQGYSKNADIFWELMFPIILLKVFYLSLKLQNKVFLFMATLFTFAEILKITAEYFSQSIGWPVALIIAGLMIMAAGYISFELNKKMVPSPIVKE